jgi:hypothetical protein
MINSLKDYFTKLKNFSSKNLILIVLSYLAIVGSFSFLYRFGNPKDYSSFWVQSELNLGGGVMANVPWYQHSLELLSHHFLGLVSLVVLVANEELLYRYWVNNKKSNKYLVRFFFCSFLFSAAGFLNSLFQQLPTIPLSETTEPPKFFINYYQQILNFLLYTLDNLMFIFVFFVAIAFINHCIKNLIDSEFDFWGTLNMDNKLWFWLSSTVFMFSHGQFYADFQFGLVSLIFTLIHFFVLPMVFYFYGFKVAFILHILWNYLLFYQFMIGVEWYESAIYNIFYWAIFAVLGYNFYKCIKDHDLKKVITT